MMVIKDGNMEVRLSANDPRVDRIRAMLARPVASNPAQTLWAECSNAHREVLVAIARKGEIEQPPLEHVLGIDAVELRGRHSGLARLCKRLGVEYPIVSVGGRRESRRFSVTHDVAREVLRLSHPNRRRSR